MVIHTAIGLFQKYHNTVDLLSTHSLASFIIDLSSLNQVGIFFFWMRLIQALVKLSIDELSAVFLNVLWLASKLL